MTAQSAPASYGNDNQRPFIENRHVVSRVVGKATSDGDGVKLTRVIGSRTLPDLDPFLLLDEFGSSDPKAYIGGFPDHPHRGFETVTYMLDGRMRHADNQGNGGTLGPGSVQWMTAGRGIVHSEMPEQVEGLMRGFQLWINLSAKNKMTEPRYQNIDPVDIPTIKAKSGALVKVIAGMFEGTQGPVIATDTDPLYFDVALNKGVSFESSIADDHNAFVYVFEGSVEIGGQEIKKSELAVLSYGKKLTVKGFDSSSRFIVVAGKPLREPVVRYGPFVMNTEEEIRQAIDDMRTGKL